MQTEPTNRIVQEGRRMSYVPKGSPRHANPGLPVVGPNGPLGFSVGDMLESRRWAVDPETGQVMDQERFDGKFRLWKSILVVQNDDGSHGLVPIARKDKYFNPQYIATDNVINFVSQEVDEAGNIRPIGFNPHGAVSGPRLFWDAKGENALTAEQTLRVVKAGKAMREIQAIQPLESVAPEEYQKKLNEILAGHGLDFATLASGLAETPEGFEQVAVTPQDIARLEEIARREEREASADRGADATVAPETFTAPCGKSCKSKAGMGAHARNCPDCLAATEVQGEAA